MNITKEQADKVIAALSMNRIMARDENGNYTKEITAQVVVEALSIMRGLADAEPVAQIGMRDGVYVDSTPLLHVGSSSFEDWYQAHEKACTGDKQLARDAYAAGMGDPLVTYATPPQAAQTALKSESSAQAAQAPARLPGEGKTIEALALTEAQEREAWLRVCREIIDRWVAPDMYKYAVAMLDLAIQADQAGRAGSKP